MKRLSREKRNQLITVILATLAVLALIGFGLIQPQYTSLSKIQKAGKTANTKLQSIRQAITNSEAIAAEWNETTYTLTQAEEDMASGDLYSWTYDTIRHFKQSYRVDIPEIGHPTIGEMDLLPAFPYKQIQFAINGTAYYHDLGKFIADFENSFPHSRIVRLTIEPGGTLDANSEKLTFRMDIITLVKPNP
jgi:regulatory protein YycH of two-component signal transduction system YycFG